MAEWEEPRHPGPLAARYPTISHTATPTAHSFPQMSTSGPVDPTEHLPVLPLLHLGSVTNSLRSSTMVPSVAPSTTRSTRRTASRSRPSSGAALAREWCSPMPVDLKPASACGHPRGVRALRRRALAELPAVAAPASSSASSTAARTDTDLDAAGRIMVPGFLSSTPALGQGGRRRRRRRPPGAVGPRRLERPTTATSRRGVAEITASLDHPA